MQKCTLEWLQAGELNTFNSTDKMSCIQKKINYINSLEGLNMWPEWFHSIDIASKFMNWQKKDNDW